MNEVKQKILEYEGCNPYIKVLKNLLNKGEELSPIQVDFARKLLFTSAIKNQDRDALPLPEIKQFDIAWDKYNNRMPFDFQKEGINWLLNKDRVILADEMGCGKTLQAIIAALECDCKKILVVCPNSLKLNWKKELEYFVPTSDIIIIKKDYIKPTKFLIINYEKLLKFWELLIKEKFDLVISDEAHYIKAGHKSKRGKFFLKISNKISKVWLLTGTPISNRPIDYFNLLKVCKHELGRRKDEFGQRYCGGIMTNWGPDLTGASNLKELYFRTQDIILRRLKKNVLDLPPKQRVPIYFEASEKRNRELKAFVQNKFNEIYEGITDPESEHYCKNIEAGEKFIELSANRMFTALEKTKDGSIEELIESCLDANKRVVLFTNYTSVINAYKEIFKEKAVILDGRVKIEDRHKIIENFQANKGADIVLANFKVGSVGINLTSAEVAIINDLPWDPATLAQAEDRIFRIGQTKPVTIYFPIYDETIDAIMFKSIRGKIDNIDVAIDGEKGLTVFQSGSVMNEVYNQIKKNL